MDTGSDPNERPWKVFLFGNGLSLCFNEEHYRLSAITERVQQRLAAIITEDGGPLLEQVDEINARLERDRDRRQPRDFEDIAGPIDRLAGLFSDIGPLVGVADPEQRGVLRTVGIKLRALYKRVVGAVLETVMDHAGQDGDWECIYSIAEHLAGVAENQGHVDAFVLNYDALLDAALLQQRDDGSTFNMMDEFKGWPRPQVPIRTPSCGLVSIPALHWREFPWSPIEPFIRVHHLHGAGTWMRYRGNVYKAEHLQRMRECGVFSAWAEGMEDEVEPVVILGDQKESSVTSGPFNETYQRLAASLSRATDVVVAGYSFGDEPLNAILREYRPPDARMRVVNSGGEAEGMAKGALGIQSDVQAPWLIVDNRGLPDGLVG